MGRTPCCDKQGLKKGPWTPEEDKILVDFIQSNGHGSWRSLPKLAGLLRCGKSCRLRWTNYLRPDIKRGPFTGEEQKSIIQLHGIVGNKWSTIAAQLPGRTDNEIKNYWNTHLKKRLRRMGLDPDTYAAASPTAASSPASAATRHMAQWESARLEAEARLSRESLLFSSASAASTSAAGSSHQHPGVPTPTPEPDIFLRMWHSDVGSAFRNPGSSDRHPAAASPAESSPESSSTKHGSAVTVSAADAAFGERREDAESKSCVSSGGEARDAAAGAAATDSSSSNEVEGAPEEDAYQLYLDFAGDDLGLFHGQLGSYSLFSSDLNEASLDTDFK